nr:amidase family protein [Streptomyces sp. NBC_00995]
MTAAVPTVTEVIAAVASGRTTALSQTSRCIQAHRKRVLHAFTQVDVPAALAAADEIDRAAGERDLPLRGVVLAIKDNIDTAGFATTAGTPALRTNRPAHDAPAVGALRDRGAVVLGKSNMHELAYGATSNNARYGRVRNPLRADRIAGGSSGGSAAAVAAGWVTAALGTETGCSVRAPAALCGLVGFRPTVGSYPAEGVVPVSWTRDTIGILARSVDDIALLDTVLRTSGDHAGECGDVGVLRGLRLAAPRRPFRSGMTATLQAGFENRLAALERVGVQVVEDELPDGVEEAASACGLPIALYETPRGIDRYLRTHGSLLRFPDVAAQVASPDVARLLRPLAERGVAEEVYRTALTYRGQLDHLLSGFVADRHIDGFIVPTVPVTAPRLLADDHIDVGGGPTPAFPLLLRNTDVSSILGWPSITLPAARDADGLPFGIDLQFPPGADRTLIAVGRACEQAWRYSQIP